MRYDSKEFLSLRREWYRRLEQSGFKDCETVDWKSGETDLKYTAEFKPHYRYTPEKARWFALLEHWARKRHAMGTLSDDDLFLAVEGPKLRRTELTKKLGVSLNAIRYRRARLYRLFRRDEAAGFCESGFAPGEI